jgi:hypothetical protein
MALSWREKCSDGDGNISCKVEVGFSVGVLILRRPEIGRFSGTRMESRHSEFHNDGKRMNLLIALGQIQHP